MNERESIFEKLRAAQDDMNAHSYNSYLEDDEYPIIFTVNEIRWLLEEFS